MMDDHYPGKGAQLRSNRHRAERGAADVSRHSLTATQAKAGPILTAAGGKMVSGAHAVSGRATALSETLAARHADVAARKATPSARDATQAADTQTKPVTSNRQEERPLGKDVLVECQSRCAPVKKKKTRNII